jgi:hypothetical protein
MRVRDFEDGSVFSLYGETIALTKIRKALDSVCENAEELIFPGAGDRFVG